MEYKETGEIKDIDKTRLFARILGELFQAEEVEIESFGDWVFPEILIKGHLDISFSQMTLLRNLNESFFVDITEEIEDYEEVDVGEGDKIQHPITRLIIRIIPYENTVKELQGYKFVKEEKE